MICLILMICMICIICVSIGEYILSIIRTKVGIRLMNIAKAIFLSCIEGYHSANACVWHIGSLHFDLFYWSIANRGS